METRQPFMRLLIATFVAALTLMTAPLAQGQAPPPAPPRDAISGSSLTDQQKAAIKAYANYWTGILAAASTPEDVERARAALLQPLVPLNNPSDLFRYEYAGFIEPALSPVMKLGQLHAAINAARVLGEIGSDRALKALLNNLNVDAKDERWQVRLHAAIGVRNNLQSGAVDARSVADAVRKLVDSTKNENRDLILRYKFEAIAAAADRTGLDAAARQDARLKLVGAIHGVVQRIKNDQQAPNPLMDAVRNAIVKFRNVYISGKLNLQEQTELGQRIGPDLGDVLVIANVHWQAVQADEQMAKQYGNFVQVVEDFLKRIDGYTRGPNQSPRTQLQGAWIDKQKEQFDAGVKQWTDVLAKAPYTG
jgi:hypothetical protein